MGTSLSLKNEKSKGYTRFYVTIRRKTKGEFDLVSVNLPCDYLDVLPELSKEKIENVRSIIAKRIAKFEKGAS
jgi:hypothetical protein